MNLSEKESNFNSGMRPVMYSMKSGKAPGWKRCGENILYYINHLKKESN